MKKNMKVGYVKFLSTKTRAELEKECMQFVTDGLGKYTLRASTNQCLGSVWDDSKYPFVSIHCKDRNFPYYYQKCICKKITEIPKSRSRNYDVRNSSSKEHLYRANIYLPFDQEFESPENPYMFSNVKYGWVHVDIGGYREVLSYITCIPREWLTQAIFGMEHNTSFVVSGEHEPGRSIFIITETSCHAFYEADPGFPKPSNPSFSILPVGMIEFCKQLYQGISDNIDEWTLWMETCYLSRGEKYPYNDPTFIENKKWIESKLKRLKELIDTKEQTQKGESSNDQE